MSYRIIEYTIVNANYYNTLLTSCWSKGHSAHYAYYLCHNKSCIEYKKSIRKENIEREFEALLIELRPSQELFYCAKDMFHQLWEERSDISSEQAKVLKLELDKIDKKVEQFLERIIDAEHHTVVKAYDCPSSNDLRHIGQI